MTSCRTYFRSWHLAPWHVLLMAVSHSLELLLALQRLQPERAPQPACLGTPLFISIIPCPCAAAPKTCVLASQHSHMQSTRRRLLTYLQKSWKALLPHSSCLVLPLLLPLLPHPSTLFPLSCSLSSLLGVASLLSVAVSGTDHRVPPRGVSLLHPFPRKVTASDLELSCSRCKKIFSILISFHIFRNNLCMNIHSA